MRILIFCLILCYGSAELHQCPANQIECNNGRHCCPVIPCSPLGCGENMQCNDLMRCQCASGFQHFYDVHTNAVECVFVPPSICENHNDCGPNALCSPTNKCQCNEGFDELYIAETQSVYCKKSDSECPVGYQKCSEEQCCGPAAQCINGQCVCEPGVSFKINDNGKALDCEKQITHGEALPVPSRSVNDLLDDVVDGLADAVLCDAGYHRCSKWCCSPQAACILNACIHMGAIAFAVIFVMLLLCIACCKR